MSLVIKDMEFVDVYIIDYSVVMVKEIIEYYIKFESDYVDELIFKIRKINDYMFEDCIYKLELWGVGFDLILMDVMELMLIMEKYCLKYFVKENVKKDDFK